MSEHNTSIFKLDIKQDVINETRSKSLSKKMETATGLLSGNSRIKSVLKDSMKKENTLKRKLFHMGSAMMVLG